jgi:hypothetical protein
MGATVQPEIYDVKSKRSRLLLLLAQLRDERANYESHWQELSDFLKPRARFQAQDGKRGQKRSNKIIDSTGTMALRTTSSGMHSGLTNPAREWFRLTVPDQTVAQLQEVKEWLHEVATRMLIAFARSNWYNSLPIAYSDEAQFGTAAMLMDEDEETTIRTYTFQTGSYYLGTNSSGRVDTFAREFQMTVWQLVDKFGKDNCSQTVRDAYDRGQMMTRYDVVHVITPNWEYDPQIKRSRDKRFYSCYFELSAGGPASSNSVQPDLGDYVDSGRTRPGFLRESGYDEFPVFGIRWEVGDQSVYGDDCPGMTALADVKQLQAGEKLTLQMLEKLVKPPMRAPVTLQGKRSSTVAGEVTYVPDRTTETYAPAYQLDSGGIKDAEYKQSQVRQRIERAFFADIFMLFDMRDEQEGVGRQPITAAEVAERSQERLLVIGPVLEQNNQDLHSPAINRLFAIMWRRGEIPPPPMSLQGQQIRVEFISILHQAQKMVGIGGLERFSGEVTQLAELDPSVLDKVNRDKLIEHFADMNGAPPDVIVSDEDVAQVRAARAKAQQQQALAEQAPKMATAAQTASQTDPNAGMLPQVNAALAGAGGLNA